VNQTVDNMGFQNALAACFTLHQLNHSHWMGLHEGSPVATEADGVPPWNAASPVVLARPDSVRTGQ
jgi:enoyl-CoA hydratase